MPAVQPSIWVRNAFDQPGSSLLLCLANNTNASSAAWVASTVDSLARVGAESSGESAATAVDHTPPLPSATPVQGNGKGEAVGW